LYFFRFAAVKSAWQSWVQSTVNSLVCCPSCVIAISAAASFLPPRLTDP
jgi:hypothetical protein